MAKSQPQQSSMVLLLDGGVNEQGEVVRLRKSFNNLNLEVTADQLYAVATSLVVLQQHELIAIERSDTSEISQQS